MHSTIYEKWLVRIIGGLLALAIISPVVFHLGLFSPHSVPKTAWFNITTELAAVFFIILASFYPRYRPKSTLLTWALLIFLITQFLAVITSGDPLLSFFGNSSRGAGFWHSAHYFILYIIGSTLIHSQKIWHALFGWSVLVSTVLSIVSLILLFTQKNFINIAGNTTYVAIFLYFNLFFALILANKLRMRWAKVLLGLVALLHLLTIFVIGTRAILLALGIITLISVAYGIYKGERKTKKIALIVAAIGVIGYAGLFAFRNNDFVKRQYFLNRITHISLQDQTLQSRFLLWEIGLKGFAEKPITGWGQENFGSVFEKYYDPQFYSIGLGENWQDRTHNILIDQLIHGGILSFAAYALMFAIAFIELSKGKAPAELFLERHILIALLSGYLLQGFFFFDTINGFVPLVVVFSYINALSLRSAKEIANKKGRWVAWLTALAGTIFFLYTIFYVTLAPLAGNYHLVQAHDQYKIHDNAAFNKNYEKGKSLIGIQNISLQETLRTFIEQINKFSQKNNVYLSVKPMLIDLEALSTASPDIRTEYNLGRYYLNEFAATSDPRFAEKAYGIARALHEKHPNRQFFAVLHAQTLSALGKHSEAVAVLTVVQRLAADNGKLSWEKLRILVRAGRNIEAAVEAEEAFKNGYLPKSLDEYITMGDLLMGYSTSYQTAIQIYEEAVNKYPNNAKPFEQLMYAYAQMGDTRKMLLTARAVLVIDRSEQKHAIVKKFIEEQLKKNPLPASDPGKLPM